MAVMQPLQLLISVQLRMANSQKFRASRGIARPSVTVLMNFITHRLVGCSKFHLLLVTCWNWRGLVLICLTAP